MLGFDDTKVEPNGYPTWSIGLVMYYNAMKAMNPDAGIYRKMYDTELTTARSTIGGWMSKVTDNYKTMDLGGGDQKTLGSVTKDDVIALYPEEYPEESNLPPTGKEKDLAQKKKKLDIYRRNVGVLLTAGSDVDREKNVDIFNNKDKEWLLKTKVSALKIDMETKLTALSFFDRAVELLNQSDTTKDVILIPIGSTDLHIIHYNKPSKFSAVVCKHENISNFATWTKKRGLKNVYPTGEHVTIVFAGSARYYPDIFKNNETQTIENETQATIKTLKENLLDRSKYLNVEVKNKKKESEWIENVNRILKIIQPLDDTRFDDTRVQCAGGEETAKLKIHNEVKTALGAIFPKLIESYGGGRSRRRRTRRNKRHSNRRGKKKMRQGSRGRKMTRRKHNRN